MNQTGKDKISINFVRSVIYQNYTTMKKSADRLFQHWNRDSDTKIKKIMRGEKKKITGKMERKKEREMEKIMKNFEKKFFSMCIFCEENASDIEQSLDADCNERSELQYKDKISINFVRSVIYQNYTTIEKKEDAASRGANCAACAKCREAMRK